MYSFDSLKVQFKKPQLQTCLYLAYGREIEKKELGTAQRYVRIGHLRLQYLLLLLLGGQHGEQLLDALLVYYGAVHFDDGRLDDAWWRQRGHADHDHVGALGVQYGYFFFAFACFL